MRAFMPQIHAARPQKFQADICQTDPDPGRRQSVDPPGQFQQRPGAYTLRCIPQVHGAVRSAIDYARTVVETELNSVTDNPLLFFEGDVIEVFQA
jgi:histidine ammonia-lyase